MCDPGRFNYHLNELCRYYLRDPAEGCELNYRGSRILVSADAEVDPDRGSNAGEGCPVCGGRDCDRLIHVHLAGPTTG